MKILAFPFWKQRDFSVQASPTAPFKPSPAVIHGYANDIEKHGSPLDSDMPAYFRKCADYFEKDNPHD